MSGAQPKKYVKIDGVMKMNPAYKAWKNNQKDGSPPILASATALPVVSNMDDHMKMNEDLGMNVLLAESTDATIEMMQEPEISLAAGMQPDEMVDKLGEILAKYEVPIGLMNKLMMLSEYASLEFIVDDSGSMQMDSDTINPKTKRANTRWEEAHQRLKEMVEILAYVPFNQIGVEFLNRKDRISLKRNGMAPPQFLAGAHDQIDAIFARKPSGTTPALEKIQESFLRGQGVNIARYIFGDGLPNGGQVAIKEIVSLIKNRVDPAMNPVTFLSCTNDDDAVEWMKDAEEVAPYCSESDDYGDESREVLGDQGEALPYTRGFWLICQLVAAMNPDDLDAMDESVPFTKQTLDNLLGIQHNEQSFRYYFDCFVKNQQIRKVRIDSRTGQQEQSDLLKKRTQWNYQEFLRAPVAKQIPQVQQYNRQMAQIL
ncbi:hypothetical protein FRACYDRAFT_267134 [Fragilariopsis cylindrus CCMP1102]|uniref:Uncharacterized protein n=1 Tax=Fragilariopsis cylindrus CCMP1102 TaxID=635003 RepID=A0A1E7FV71_9STRA|nr:hypothetical protein FRACYDRAFT_267134 [Fragilariopsis cylindrus CCMP1102]|eukprot:OEU22046.1 hypothetical protein FRACYDRAFT_267134 [Fragilariopsis cylindrus CCMP1102]